LYTATDDACYCFGVFIIETALQQLPFDIKFTIVKRTGFC
jgi:hypothetical protein